MGLAAMEEGRVHVSDRPGLTSQPLAVALLPPPPTYDPSKKDVIFTSPSPICF
jgi:hypothetical protein